jgi:hypothetical protein
MHSESSSGPIRATKLHREDRLELKNRSVCVCARAEVSSPLGNFGFFFKSPNFE